MSNPTLVLFDLPGPRARRRHTIVGLVGMAMVAITVALIAYGLRDQLKPAMWAPFLRPDVWTVYVLPGLWGTVKAALLAIVLSIIVGLMLGMGRLSHIAPLRWLTTVFVEFFRSVPVLIMIIFANALFRSTKIFTGDALGLAAVVTGLTLYNSCVMAELLRSGVHALPRGQREAGLALGLTRPQVLTTILVPQAITAMLPSLISQLVIILKDTALGYIVAYPELLNRLGNLAAWKGNMIPAYIIGALLFVLMNWGLSQLAQALRRRGRGRTSARMEPVMPNLVPDADPDDELYTDTHQFESADDREHRIRHPR